MRYDLEVRNIKRSIQKANQNFIDLNKSKYEGRKILNF